MPGCESGGMSTVLVTGATGFIGRRLVPALVEAGHTVRAMTRRPDDYHGAGRAVGADVSDPALGAALAGVDVAYYLVHSLDDADFERKDAEAARTFGRAAADAGVEQIIYLGGLGDDDERPVGRTCARAGRSRGCSPSAGVPVTVLRAAIVVGHGGISWEITRQLVENLPGDGRPQVGAHAHPADRARRCGALPRRRPRPPEALGRVFEIGGPEVLSYLEMLQRAAEDRNGRCSRSSPCRC